MKFDTELSQACAKSVTAGMFAKQQFVRAPANIFGTHDLVGFTMLEHSVLMYARFMSERICSYNGFIRLYRKTGNSGDQLACRYDMRGIDTRIAFEKILTSPHRHHNFLQSCVACA